MLIPADLKNHKNKSIQALHYFSPKHLALVYDSFTYVWSKKTNTCAKLKGVLCFDERRSCVKQEKILRSLANFKGILWFSFFSPFKRDGNFLVTLVKKSNSLKIWSLDGKPKEVAEKKLAEGNVSSFYLIDDDRTIRVDYDDETYQEFRCIMDNFK